MCGLVLLGALVVGGRAHAQTPGDVEKAKQHFIAGMAYLDAGSYDKAIAEFQVSYALAKRPSGLYMLAVTYRRKYETHGRVADARKSKQLYDNFIKAAPRHARVPIARKTIKALGQMIKTATTRSKPGAKVGDAVGSVPYRQAIGFLAEGAFSKAVAKAQEARRQPGTRSAQLARIWLVVGRAQALAGKHEQAIVSFQKALVLEPDLQVALDMDEPDGQDFDRAKQKLRGKAPLALTEDAPKYARAGRGIRVKLTVDNDRLSMVSRLELRYRRAGQQSFSTVGGKKTSKFLIPPSFVAKAKKGYKVYYYAVALDDAGAIVATTGTARSPRNIEVLTADEWASRFHRGSSVLEKGWFWGTVAGVAAVGSAVLYFVLRPQEGGGPHIPTDLVGGN